MNKILLFFYFGGAGGKFIANCLSYSQQVAFAEYQTALKIKQDTDINLLETELLKTIPDKNCSKQWLNFEQGCNQLFGKNIDAIKQGNPVISNDFYDIGSLKPLWLPVMAHQKIHYNRLLEWFKNDQVFTVLVDSTPEFIDYAIRLKWPEPHHCLDLNHYKIFQEEIKSLQFDFEFRNWSPLTTNGQNCIIELAKKININFDLNLAKNYIDKYVEFHK